MRPIKWWFLVQEFFLTCVGVGSNKHLYYDNSCAGACRVLRSEERTRIWGVVRIIPI